MTETAAPAAPARATLSKELSEFLVELSIGVHRFSMYPSGHPSLDPIVESIIARLADILQARRTLSIGVAARQLIIEGVATEQKHPVLSELARKLHDHQLGAVVFEFGVTAPEIASLLESLAEDPGRDAVPLGMREGGDVPTWEHIELHPIGYEALTLGGAAEAGAERVSQLWLSLAQAALSAEALPEGEEPPDAGDVAAGIASHARDEAYDKVIAGYLQQLAAELKGARGREAERIRARVSQLVQSLDDRALQRIMRFSARDPEGRRFLLDANQSLAVDAVMKMVEAAAASTEQTISTSMTRLLTKLSRHAAGAVGPSRSEADTALRENIERLLADWELADPNPEAYTTVLDRMAVASPILSSPEPGEALTGAERLVQMALEIDVFGPTVRKAVMDLIREGGTARVLELLDAAPADSDAARRIRELLTSPVQFRKILGAGHVDAESLERLVQEMGEAAIDPLLDVLAESDSRAVRRRVFDLLPRLGPQVPERALERLEDHRWFVKRNMLALLSRLEELPEEFDPRPFLKHDDHRVRREALPLAMRPGSPIRDEALVQALSDDDERMVRMALLQIQERIPAAAVGTLVNKVIRSDKRSPEIRALAVRCLAGTDQPLARMALLELVVAGKTLLGKPRLHPTSSVLLEAVRVLALRWSGREDVEEVLATAERSRDPDLRGAVLAGRKEADA